MRCTGANGYALCGMILAAIIFSPCPHAETLRVYTALEDEEVAVYRADFENKQPDITLEIIRDSTGIITAKLLVEKDNPQADVIWGLAASSLLYCDQKGMLTGYNPSGFERIRPRFCDQKHSPAHWVGIKAWMAVFIYNTFEMKRLGLSIPVSFHDLAKPEYKGHIIAPHPASSGTGFLMISGVLQSLGEEAGWDYLTLLDKNVAFYTHSGSKPARLTGQGEFPIAISSDYIGPRQIAEGIPVAFVFPKEGSGWDVEANALVRKPKIKAAARQFLDWAVSMDAMNLYAQFSPLTASPTGLPAPEGYPADPESQFTKNDLEWAASNRERIIGEWEKRFKNKTEKK